MEELSRLFRLAADHAAGYRRSLPDRLVGVSIDQGALVDAFSGPLPSAPSPPEQVLADLLAAAEPGLAAGMRVLHLFRQPGQLGGLLLYGPVPRRVWLVGLVRLEVGE